MKKYYILNIKSYILVTLYIVSFIIIVGEKTQNISFKTFIIIKRHNSNRIVVYVDR